MDIPLDSPEVPPSEITCAVCARTLVGDPDDQLEPPRGPMCGDCHRAREFDQTLWEMDLTGSG